MHRHNKCIKSIYRQVCTSDAHYFKKDFQEMVESIVKSCSEFHSFEVHESKYK
jgi:hypothetical protein